MKKGIVLALVATLFFFINPTEVSAQRSGCSIDTTSCSGPLGVVCPDTFTVAEAGMFYNQNVTFNMPYEIIVEKFPLPQPITIPIINITIDTLDLGRPTTLVVAQAQLLSVTGLPVGIEWECDPAIDSCTYFPDSADIFSQYGCALFFRSPCDTAGRYNLNFNFLYTLDVTDLDLSALPPPLNLVPAGLLDGVIPDTVQLPIPATAVMDVAPGIELIEVVSTPDIEYLCPTGVGSTIDLSIANGGRVSTFNWSTGDTTAVLTVGTADQYTVTIVDTFGCEQTDSLDIMLLEANSINDTTICPGQYLRLEGDGGATFGWAPSSNVADLGDGDGLAYGLTTSTDLVLSVSNGVCTLDDTVSVTVDAASCAGPCDDCTVNKASCAGLTEPGVCGTIPDLIGGVAYNESFTFFFPDTIPSSLILDAIDLGGLPINPADILPSVDLAVNSLDIELVLPDGLSWETDQIGGNHRYYPSAFPSETQYGCVTICGTTCDLEDGFELSMTATFNIELPAAIPGLGSVIPVPVDIPLDIDAGFIADLQINASGPTVIDVGETVDLSVPSGFSSIEWSTGETTQTITVTSPGVYTVEAEDANGCLQEVSLEVTAPVGITEQQFGGSISIYPNPATESFTVEIETTISESASVILYDLSGKNITQRNIELTSGTTIITDLPADLAAGVYFIRVTSEQISVTQKLIIN